MKLIVVYSNGDKQKFYLEKEKLQNIAESLSSKGFNAQTLTLWEDHKFESIINWNHVRYVTWED